MRVFPIVGSLLLALVGRNGMAEALPTINDILVGELPAGWTLTVFGGHGTPYAGELLFSLNFSTELFNIIGYATWGDIVRVPRDAVVLDETPSYTLYAYDEPGGGSFFFLRRGVEYSIVIRVPHAYTQPGFRVVAAFASIEVK